jgi:hypothetical protein
MLSDIMLNVTYKPSMLSIVMLNGVMLSVVAPYDNLTKLDFLCQKISTCPCSNVAKRYWRI